MSIQRSDESGPMGGNVLLDLGDGAGADLCQY